MKRGGAGDIFSASRTGNLARVKELVESGVDVNVKGNDGKPLLILAVIKNHIDIVKYLVEKGAHVNAKDDEGMTVLMYATANNRVDIAKYLVEKGANVNAKSDEQGITSLMIAAHNNRIDILKYLVEKGAHLNVKAMSDGMTALMSATFMKHIDVVKYLVEKGADVNAKDDDGRRACDMAKSVEMYDLVCLQRPLGVPTEERNIPAGSETEITYEEIKNGDVLVDFNKEYVHKRYYDPETVSKLKSNPHTREPIGKKTVYTAKIVAGGKRRKTIRRKRTKKMKKTRKQ